MSKVERDEIFGNLKEFLKAKGIELQEGSYTQRIRKGCDLLTDTINVSGQALKQAKTVVDRKLDRMRQVIHEKTAPKSSPRPATPFTGQTARGETKTPAKGKQTRARVRNPRQPTRSK